MGRYAFFNTGFEYKFGFATQSSHDIMELGGTGNYGLLIHEEPMHLWDERDRPYIQRVMDALEEYLDMEGPFDFSRFEKSLQGTQDLYSYFWDREKDGFDLTNPFILKYRLACILFHQLLYKKNLVAHYEL